MKNNIWSYRKQIKKLFYMSVDNNLNKWSQEPNFKNSYYGEKISNHNLVLDTKKNILTLYTSGKCDDTFICIYKILFIPIDFKMNKYANRVIKHFKTRDDIEILSDYISKYHNVYMITIRKEKIQKIK